MHGCSRTGRRLVAARWLLSLPIIPAAAWRRPPGRPTWLRPEPLSSPPRPMGFFTLGGGRTHARVRRRGQRRPGLAAARRGGQRGDAVHDDAPGRRRLRRPAGDRPEARIGLGAPDGAASGVRPRQALPSNGSDGFVLRTPPGHPAALLRAGDGDLDRDGQLQRDPRGQPERPRNRRVARHRVRRPGARARAGGRVRPDRPCSARRTRAPSSRRSRSTTQARLRRPGRAPTASLARGRGRRAEPWSDRARCGPLPDGRDGQLRGRRDRPGRPRHGGLAADGRGAERDRAVQAVQRRRDVPRRRPTGEPGVDGT